MKGAAPTTAAPTATLPTTTATATLPGAPQALAGGSGSSGSPTTLKAAVSPAPSVSVSSSAPATQVSLAPKAPAAPGAGSSAPVRTVTSAVQEASRSGAQGATTTLAGGAQRLVGAATARQSPGSSSVSSGGSGSSRAFLTPSRAGRGGPPTGSSRGLASTGARGARSIAEELFFTGAGAGAGSTAPALFAGFPANGFALALGGTWAEADAGLGLAPAASSAADISSSADGGNDLFGLPIPPEAGQAMLIVLMAFAAMCLLTLLFSNELELPARYRDWRSRWARRF